MPGDLLSDPSQVVKDAEPSCFTLFGWAGQSSTSGCVQESESPEKTVKPPSKQVDDETSTMGVSSAHEVTSVSSLEARDDAPIAAACVAVCRCCENHIRRDWRFCAHCGMYLEHSTRRAAVLVCEPTVATTPDLTGYTLETPKEEDEEPLLMAIVGEKKADVSMVSPEATSMDNHDAESLSLDNSLSSSSDDLENLVMAPEESSDSHRIDMRMTNMYLEEDTHESVDEENETKSVISRDDSFRMAQDDLIDQLE